MDNIITAALQEALELLGAGKKAEAYAILVPVIKQNPDIAQAWYLMGFAVTDSDKKLYCFQQVLRIDPSNQVAQKQIARLPVARPAPTKMETFQAQPFSTTMPAYVSTPKPAPVATPEPAPAPTKKQPPKKSFKFPIRIALAVAGVIAVIGVIALYIWNGTTLNQQVNTLFAQRKCAEVAQYNSFENSFPRFVFSSFFGVYSQVEECQTQLALEQAVKSQDWPAAYSVIENYLTAYPSGAFVADMNEQAGDILLSWSKNLVAQNEYKTAIEKLELIQMGFPTSSAVPTAQETMFNNYLLWAKNSFEQKNYQNAEEILKLAGSHKLASPKQVQQANEGLAVVYLQWGKSQVESDLFDEGVQHFEDSRKLNPGLADYDRLKD